MRARLRIDNLNAEQELACNFERPYGQEIIFEGGAQELPLIAGQVLNLCTGYTEEDTIAGDYPPHLVRVTNTGPCDLLIEGTYGGEPRLHMPAVLGPGDSHERDLSDTCGHAAVSVR